MVCQEKNFLSVGPSWARKWKIQNKASLVIAYKISVNDVASLKNNNNKNHLLLKNF